MCVWYFPFSTPTLHCLHLSHTLSFFFLSLSSSSLDYVQMLTLLLAGCCLLFTVMVFSSVHFFAVIIKSFTKRRFLLDLQIHFNIQTNTKREREKDRDQRREKKIEFNIKYIQHSSHYTTNWKRFLLWLWLEHESCMWVCTDVNGCVCVCNAIQHFTKQHHLL